MRLVSFWLGERACTGALNGDEIVLVGEGLEPFDVRDVLALPAGERKELCDCGRVISLSDVRLRIPVPHPRLILGVGLNTRSHFAETETIMNRVPGDYPLHPRLFMRTSESLVAHEESIHLPEVSDKLDFEGEIALVIGRGGRNIAAEDAWAHIGGYTLVNDGSVRDYQMHSSQVTAGKNFVSSGAAGPWIVTSDDIVNPLSLLLETWVNGERRQTLAMDDLIFSFEDLVAYASQIFELHPGDMILTGSPAGVGAVQGRWLAIGDVVEVRSPQLGVLRSRVVAAH